MKEVKVEWCKNFIESVFKKMPEGVTGIETNCFWNKAEKSGLWVRGTYDTPMSKALGELTKLENILDDNGNYLYSVFCLV